MATRGEDVAHGFTQVDQAIDPRFFIEFLDARKTFEGEREVKQLIIDSLDLRPGLRVLDIGSGTGDDAREIAGFVGSNGLVVGIDLSDALIAESKRRSAASNLPVEFRLGDVRKLDFPNASFDRIRTDRVLMFVPEIEVAIAEMVRVLRPGGRLVASELDHELRYVDSRLPEINRKVHDAWIAINPQPPSGSTTPSPLFRPKITQLEVHATGYSASVPDVPACRRGISRHRDQARVYRSSRSRCLAG